ncbi:hypothetical protein HYW72_00125 [Candidatus Nomurabacteria bacterium]|nr:hypothetical protein [Candidatus Nomurabacteria bacterium]
MPLDNLIYLAVSLNFIGHILYVQSIIQEHAKPNLPILAAGLGSLLIMMVAIFTKNGFWKISA